MRARGDQLAGTTGGFEDREPTHDPEPASPSDSEPASEGRGHGPGEMRARAVGDALWIGALRDEIVRGGPGSEPAVAAARRARGGGADARGRAPQRATATFGRFAQAVRTAVRNRDVLACETESRAWIIARDTGRAGAQALGSRIATAVPAEESWRGAPLTVSVGLAVLGEDGHNAAALIDAAEQTRFAAEASGIGIVSGGPRRRESPKSRRRRVRRLVS